MRLSIIIPCYNAEPYIGELLKRLYPQLNPEVEVIVIDDGSKVPFLAPVPGVKVIRQENGGASSARNRGLNEAQGEYIAFIDADDLVSDDYIERIFAELDKNPDYVYLSWESFGGWNQRVIIKSTEDEFPPFNLCVWNRVYKKSLIGKTRFNTKKLIAEDAEFIRKVQKKGKKGFISEPIYKYRSNTPNSLTKRFAEGKLDTSRIVYYFDKVTADKTDLIDEFKKADKEGEVILLTNRNDIPELTKYAMVMAPCRMKATEKRGEPTNLIEIIERPLKAQIVVYTQKTFEIGGIETFTYQFCRNLSKYYNILVLYDQMNAKQIRRLIPYAECRKNDRRVIECDFLIVNRITDKIPENVKAKKTIQMVHGVKQSNYHVPQDKDMIVAVSEVVKESFGDESESSIVIPNMLDIDAETEKPLLLVSATRTDTAEKGFDRMIALANLMKAQGVNYLWLCFMNTELPKDAPKGMVKMTPTLDILPWIQKADYLVQLSDHEAFCYSIVEALSVGTAVITTPISVLGEISVNETNSYIVPFDLDGYDTTQFYNVPEFSYKYDNTELIKKWRSILGNKKPEHKYKPPKMVKLLVKRAFYDTELQINAEPGMIHEVSPERAKVIIEAGYAERK